MINSPDNLVKKLEIISSRSSSSSPFSPKTAALNYPESSFIKTEFKSDSSHKIYKNDIREENTANLAKPKYNTKKLSTNKNTDSNELGVGGMESKPFAPKEHNLSAIADRCGPNGIDWKITMLDGTQTVELNVADEMGKQKKTHVCLFCGKIYNRKYGLKIHLRTHTGYKPLKCKVCSRPFSDPSNLNKHVRLHSQGDTPYRCPYCGKILVRKRDLDRHIMSRHSGKECSSPTNNDSYTVNHNNDDEELESMNNDNNSNDDNSDDKVNIEVDSCESPNEITLQKLIESK